MIDARNGRVGLQEVATICPFRVPAFMRRLNVSSDRAIIQQGNASSCVPIAERFAQRKLVASEDHLSPRPGSSSGRSRRIYAAATEDAYDSVVKEDTAGTLLTDPSKWVTDSVLRKRSRKIPAVELLTHPLVTALILKSDGDSGRRQSKPSAVAGSYYHAGAEDAE